MYRIDLNNLRYFDFSYKFSKTFFTGYHKNLTGCPKICYSDFKKSYRVFQKLNKVSQKLIRVFKNLKRISKKF